MSLISLIVTLIVIGVLLWLVNTYIPMDGKIKKILNAVVVICVVVWLLFAFGILNHWATSTSHALVSRPFLPPGAAVTRVFLATTGKTPAVNLEARAGTYAVIRLLIRPIPARSFSMGRRTMLLLRSASADRRKLVCFFQRRRSAETPLRQSRPSASWDCCWRRSPFNSCSMPSRRSGWICLGWRRIETILQRAGIL